ncbi:MAG: RNA polymerase sigma factor RpoE [Elusimicrobia bacterium CG08_land_8_20_14_0_20_51_18]|nr:MAG: RNA polymerase sigma factor RpoE [Elusimicrobia bacterium CG08_land_8_20_14_0_20_51_18]
MIGELKRFLQFLSSAFCLKPSAFLNMENEESLLKKITSGEKEFFGELVLKHQDFIFNVVKNYVRFEEEARDITQEVFVKAYENIDKFRGDSRFSSWLYRIAYNLSINWSERKRDREIQLDDEFAETLVSEEDPVDLAFEKELLAADINRVIEELPEKYRIVIKLYYFEEKSYQETADTLGIPINTVKIQLLRAKKIITEKMWENNKEQSGKGA